MENKIMTKDPAHHAFIDSKSALEKMYIEEYLQGRGLTLNDLQAKDPVEVKQLMVQACNFSSHKLAELESKAKFREKIHFQ
jgi:hypothetical protein